MRYLDLPTKPSANARVALPLHGANLCAGDRTSRADALRDIGYRVIIPEHVGFCDSDKPHKHQFGSRQLALNTKMLPEHLDVTKVSVVAHSMGGMRSGVMYPQVTERVVPVNPIDLENLKAKGADYRSIDVAYAAGKSASLASLEKYLHSNDHDGEWKPEYVALARELASFYEGPDGDAQVWNAALTSDMIYTQPVACEFESTGVPATLIIGLRDRMAIGRDTDPKALAKALDDYRALGRAAAKRIPHATFVECGALATCHIPKRPIVSAQNH